MFSEALHLCPKNDTVDETDKLRLSQSGSPVVAVPAYHTGLGASKATRDDAKGLHAKIIFDGRNKGNVNAEFMDIRGFNKQDNGNNWYVFLS